jgi:hypothetical protein
MPLTTRSVFLLLSAMASCLAAAAASGDANALKARLEPTGLPPQDIIATVFTDFAGIPMAMGARAWRQELPAYIAIAEPGMPLPLEEELELSGLYYGETWAAWPYKSLYTSPDPPPAFVNKEQAAALAILAAHKHAAAASRSYKWMLAGPPELVFFAGTARRLLAAFDHTLPTAITDAFVYGDAAPSPLFPRCLPCHYKVPCMASGMALLPRGQAAPCLLLIDASPSLSAAALLHACRRRLCSWLCTTARKAPTPAAPQSQGAPATRAPPAPATAAQPGTGT